MDFYKTFLNSAKYSNKLIWLLIGFISVYSLLLVKSISRETFNYFSVQLLSVLIGLLGAFFLQAFNYKTLAKFWKWLAVFGIFLIGCTLFAGVKVEGSMGINAKAWLRLPGGITFQPSELVKIFFTVTFAHHLAKVKKENNFKNLKDVFLIALHAFVPVLLTHLQGDDGAAIIFMFTALTMAFIAGVPFRYFAAIFVFAALCAPVLWNFVLADYQKRRILTQMNPEADPLNMGYQQIQGMLSIGSGGLFGRGLFNGPRVANGVVPVQESDFIFAAAGEELGFFGCLLILILLAFLIFRLGFIAKNCGDETGALICFGIIGIIVSQTIFNLGMCLSLLPVMGVTLPFFSVGGSSASCLYFGIGIAQNVYLNSNKTAPILEFEEE